jgi:hypothetical protein
MVPSETSYLAAADALLFTHVLFVAFVIVGLLLILVGRLFSWSWVRNPWFRMAHLIGIVVVVLQSWLGVTCPLTIWEMELRSKAGDVVYAGSFISHWLEKVLYFQAPDWVFIVCYTTFGLSVLLSWFWVRPFPFSRMKNSDPT